MTLRLQITEPDGENRVADLNRPRLLIGRGGDCDIRLKADVVSSKHARLKAYRGTVMIEDLQATNGTFLNGVRIVGELALNAGDSVQFGAGGPQIRLLPDGEQPQQPSLAVTNTGQRKFSLSTIWIISGIAILCLTCLLSGTLGLVAVMFGFGRNSATVGSIQDEQRLSNAVGFVIYGTEFELNGVTKTLPFSTGTSFAVSADGYLLTNRHVVTDSDDAAFLAQIKEIESTLQKSLNRKVWVVFDDGAWPAEILHISDEYDLSVLKIDRSDMPFFRIASADDLARTQQVYAVGFPGAAQIAVSEEEELEEQLRGQLLHADVRKYFKARDFEFILTDGSVSRVTEEIGGRRWVQHNADINGGNSGGPLCLENGLVVGVNTLGVSGASGVFFSISPPQLRSEIERFVPTIVWDTP